MQTAVADDAGAEHLRAGLEAQREFRWGDALRHLEAATQQNSARACFELARALRFGGLTLRDNLPRKIELYRRSSELGYGPAMACYATYLVDESKGEEAAVWAQCALASGDPYALGFCAFHGTGVPEDYERAAEFLVKSAEQNFSHAFECLGILYEAFDENMPGLAMLDDRVSLQWYIKAANMGLSHAQFELGFSYDKGRGTDVNKSLSLHWYRHAAQQGHGAAMLELAKACYDVRSSACDWPMAARHLALAVDTMHRDYRKWAVTRALLRLRMSDDDLADHPREWRLRELYQFGRVFATNERVLAALVPAQPTAVENALELYRRTRAQATHAAVIFMGLRRRARCVVAMLPRDVAALLARALWAQRVAPDVWQPAGPSVRRSKRIKLKQARAVAKCE